MYSAVHCTEGEIGIGETGGSDSREIMGRDGGKETEKIRWKKLDREETEDRDRGGEAGGGTDTVEGRNEGLETEGRDIEMEIKRQREDA